MRAGNFFLGAIILSLAGYYGLRMVYEPSPARIATEPPKSQALLRGGALLIAQNAVLAQLKAPATAQFGETQINQYYDLWEIAGHVDSQNSFGAMLRSTYQVKVIYRCMETQLADCWRIDSLTISK
jgi:hypothetical protein